MYHGLVLGLKNKGQPNGRRGLHMEVMGSGFWLEELAELQHASIAACTRVQHKFGSRLTGAAYKNFGGSRVWGLGCILRL